MLFLARKFLEPWLMPMGFGCLLLLVAFLLIHWRPRTARALALLGLATLWIPSTGAVAGRMLAPLERAYAAPASTLRAEAAVVLAGSVDLARSAPDRLEFGDAPERILAGAELVRKGRARRLIIAGGSGDPLRPEASEADLLARFALDLGVPPRAIYVQSKGRTTEEDARHTAGFLKDSGIGRFFLVTSAYHMPRAVAWFRKAGADPIPYPVDYRATPQHADLARYTPTASSLRNATLALHEYGGYAAYWLSGRLGR
jgi:uncharacterized SAM-binding protein YcdF (DUF218 family)